MRNGEAKVQYNRVCSHSRIYEGHRRFLGYLRLSARPISPVDALTARWLLGGYYTDSTPIRGSPHV